MYEFFKAVFSLAFVGFMVTRGFCVSDATALHAAENTGYASARLTDAKHVLVGFRGCDAHDAAGFAMQATNSAGKPADIIICCGWPFKGCTVRTP